MRSSATAEDLPDASFAGQLETFLNVRGEEALLEACKRCYASLFTDRAIVYRRANGYDHMKVALSIGVQKMVRSDKAGAGVMFSIDTETGFARTVLVTAAWGLGETVVQGMVEPDEYQVFKPLLDRAELTPIVERKLGAKAQKLVYGRSAATKLVRTRRDERKRYVLRDAEVLQLARWACAIEAHYGQPMDIEWAKDGDTGELFIVQARPETVQSRREAGALRAYRLERAGAQLVWGLAVGDSIASGGSDGLVRRGRRRPRHTVEEIRLDSIAATRTKVMVNVGDPAAAFRWWRLPTDGVGLARMEFIIGSMIRVHPMALVHPEKVRDARARAHIERITRGYADKADYFVDALARGVARIAAAHYPNPVIVRLSDFKTNEYARLIGGEAFEPAEENPMLGWRGASRYYSEGYREGFALECRALRRAREELGLTNIVVMVPFCRSPEEADRVLAEMACHGLVRGGGLEVFVMCEIPSNVILAERFAERFDGFSIGSNDLTQLVLGVDRDNATLKALFDERNPAVTDAIATLLAKAAHTATKTGICGQAPSDHPEFARFLVEHGIGSISVTPDSFLAVKRVVAEAEAAARVIAIESVEAAPRRGETLPH